MFAVPEKDTMGAEEAQHDSPEAADLRDTNAYSTPPTTTSRKAERN